MSRLARCAVLPLLLLGPAQRDAGACTCVGPRGCDADDAAVLFVGEVLDVWTGHRFDVARIRVDRALRGAVAGQVLSVATTRTSCGVGFLTGYRWLIATDRAEPGRRVEGHGASLGVDACGGSGMLRPGEPDPVFPSRSDIGGRITRFTNSIRADGPRVAGVRVWVTTPSGVIESRTDQDGDFLLRDVPLDPPRRLHVDLPAGEEIRPVRLGAWTPEACGLLSLVVRPVQTRRAR